MSMTSDRFSCGSFISHSALPASRHARRFTPWEASNHFQVEVGHDQVTLLRLLFADDGRMI